MARPRTGRTAGRWTPTEGPRPPRPPRPAPPLAGAHPHRGRELRPAALPPAGRRRPLAAQRRSHRAGPLGLRVGERFRSWAPAGAAARPRPGGELAGLAVHLESHGDLGWVRGRGGPGAARHGRGRAPGGRGLVVGAGRRLRDGGGCHPRRPGGRGAGDLPRPSAARLAASIGDHLALLVPSGTDAGWAPAGSLYTSLPSSRLEVVLR